MPLICPNSTYIKVYQHDYVTNGKAHGLFAIYKTKNDMLAGNPPLHREHIDFTYDISSSDTIEEQAESVILLLNDYLACSVE